MPQKNDRDRPSMDGERLRDAIDKGLTGDKVPAADPAAAPLGTDDEAAGMPPPRPTGGPVPPDQRTPPGHAKGDDAFMPGDYGTRAKRDA